MGEELTTPTEITCQLLHVSSYDRSNYVQTSWNENVHAVNGFCVSDDLLVNMSAQTD